MPGLVSALLLALSWTAIQTQSAADTQAAAPPSKPSRPWLIVPLVSSNPKLGTSGGALVGYATKFDDASRVSIFGAMYQYTSTDSSIAGLFARTSFGADHHRVLALAGFGAIKNDYDDYLGTGKPLQTNDDLQGFFGRYLYRAAGHWFVGMQGTAANYQIIGDSPEDEMALETLGIRGFSSAALGAVFMRDSRDNDDMPSRGWFLNVNNLAYREALGGADSFDAYRADIKAFVPHGKGHVFAIRQFNWVTAGAPTTAQATVILRGYKFGQYLAPYMSSLEGEERFSFNRRWGATLFTGVAGVYGEGSAVPLSRHAYPTWGGGVHFVIKPDQHLLVNFEYAQGIEDNRGYYVKFGYGW